MRKFTTLFSAALLGTALSASAQTVLDENFEGTTGSALPATWSQVKKGTTGWKTNSGSITFASTPGWAVPAHTRYAVVDDWNTDETNDTTRLVSPSMDLTSVTGAWLSYNYFFIGATYGTAAGTEQAYVSASTDGGTTWTTIDTLGGDPTGWQFQGTSLAAYNGMSNVKIAFTYHDGTGATNKLIGLAVDDISIAVPSANDVAVTTITLPVLAGTDQIAANGTTVKVTVRNMGSATLSSVKAEYKLNSGAAVSQTFSGLTVAPFTSTELTFSTTLTGVTTAAQNLSVEATEVNGGADAKPADNQATSAFVGASKTGTRAGLIEEFSSSTCPPCASFNAVFDPLVVSLKTNETPTNFNVIKYQMNWPGLGNDASYNAHGNTRRGYYGVSAIPDHFVNGAQGGAGDQAEIDASKAPAAYLDINGTYVVTGDSMWVDFGVTPYFNSTKGLKVFAAIVENDYYNNAATTSQLHYVYIMRSMLPNADGVTVNNWADNTPVNYSYKVKATIGNNKQMDYNLWTHPKNTNIIVFVQDAATGTILNSKAINAQWPTNVATMGAINNVSVYPNPAKDFTTVGFNLNKSDKVSVVVTDMMGRVVFTAAEQSFDAGLREVRIPTANMAAGQYNVTVKSNSTSATHSLVVAK